MTTVDNLSVFAVLLAAATLAVTWFTYKNRQCRFLWVAVPALLVAGLADLVLFLMATSAAASLAIACGLKAWLLRKHLPNAVTPNAKQRLLSQAVRGINVAEALIAIPAVVIALLSPMALDAGDTVEAFEFIVFTVCSAILLVAVPVGSIKIARSRGAAVALVYSLLPLLPLVALFALDAMR